MTFWQILPTIISLLGTVIIGLVGWGYRSDRAANEKENQRQTNRIDKLETDFNDLKADLPLIYVTRTDYLQTMNKVDDRIKNMDNKLDRVLDRLVSRGG